MQIAAILHIVTQFMYFQLVVGCLLKKGQQKGGYGYPNYAPEQQRYQAKITSFTILSSKMQN